MQKLLAAAAAFVFCPLTIIDLCAPTRATRVKTDVSLPGHVLKAYIEEWKYNYGFYDQLRDETRHTDCSGLIRSYLWWTGDGANPSSGPLPISGTGSGMLEDARSKGTINYSSQSSLLKTYDLILYQPGHVGVYVGDNVGIGNRDVGYDMKKEPILGRARNKWTTRFKLTQLSYLITGLIAYDRNEYYYENGERATKTTRTIGDEVYTIGVDGIIAASISMPEVQTRQAAALAEAAAKTATESVRQTAVSEPVPVNAMQAVRTLLSPVS